MSNKTSMKRAEAQEIYHASRPPFSEVFAPFEGQLWERSDDGYWRRLSADKEKEARVMANGVMLADRKQRRENWFPMVEGVKAG